MIFSELFDKESINSKIILANIREYIEKIGFLEFDQAKQIIITNLELLDREKSLLKKGDDGTKLNRIYIIRQFLIMLRDYSAYWDEVISHEFVASWKVTIP